jgi:hypothetical protein
MTWRYSIARPSGYATESNGIAWSVFANELLLYPPPRLDGIEVRGIGRQVDNADAFCRAGRDDARVVVSWEIVEDQDIASAQLRQQGRFQPVDEAVLVDRLERAAERDPLVEANRTKQAQVLAPVHRGSVLVDRAFLDPGMAARHGDVQPRFVDEDEPFGAHSVDLDQERDALGPDIRA